MENLSRHPPVVRSARPRRHQSGTATITLRTGAPSAFGSIVVHVIRVRLKEKARAGYHRIVPSARPWSRIGDFVTFKDHGFVAAHSPVELLARHNYEIAEINHVLGDRLFRRSLELGCGFGRLSPYLGRQSARHLGVDVNKQAVECARSLYPGIDYGLASMTDLPLADSSFDLVTTWTVVQHLPPRHVDRALSEMVRVATADALLLLCEQITGADEQGTDKWHTHTWHRQPEFYAERLAPYRLKEHRPVPGFTSIGLPVPGEVMLFSL